MKKLFVIVLCLLVFVCAGYGHRPGKQGFKTVPG